jgi:TatD DNase family protein
VSAARPAAPPPEPLPAPSFDGHCHLDLIGAPVPDILDQARAAGISRVITVGVDLETSRWSARCAAQYRDVYAAVAVHPNETGRAAGSAAGRDAVLAELASLAGQPDVLAIGETGLDYYRDSAPADVQADWFRAHIRLARQAGKPLMIHDRDAHADVLRILAEEGAPEQVIFHCFSGDAELAKRCAEAGYVMSFAGTVTFSNAQQLREAARAAPAELILAETDAPFLTPVPNRGKLNAPAQVAHTIRALAAARGQDVGELCEIIAANGERVFGPWRA